MICYRIGFHRPHEILGGHFRWFCEGIPGESTWSVKPPPLPRSRSVIRLAVMPVDDLGAFDLPLATKIRDSARGLLANLGVIAVYHS